VRETKNALTVRVTVPGLSARGSSVVSGAPATDSRFTSCEEGLG
jgi:hypothetical protein